MERGRVGHEWTVYNELLHVPLMIWNPRSNSRGRVEEPVSTLVIHNYVLAAVDGRDLESPPPVVSRAFHYYGKNLQHPREFRTRPNEFSLVRDNLKIIYTPGKERYELYDLDRDPGERTNLWGKSAAGQELARELRQWMKENRSDADPATNEAIQSYIEMVERLKALGYTR